MRYGGLGLVVMVIGALAVSGCASSSPASETTAPMERFSTAAEAVNGKIYLIGGMDSSGRSLDVVEEYNPTNGTWTTKAPMPTARVGAESAVWNGEIYIIGGQSGARVLPTVERYNVSTISWTTLPEMPTARWYPMVEAVDGTVYMVGGVTGTGDNRQTVSAFEAFAVRDNAWTKIPDTPFHRQNGGIAAVGGDLHVVSGRTGTGTGESTDARVDKSVTSTGRWTTVASLPEGRTGVRGAATENGRVVVAGGAAGERMMPEVMVYSPQTDRWEQQGSLKFPRSGQSCRSDRQYALRSRRLDDPQCRRVHDGGRVIQDRVRLEPSTDAALSVADHAP